MNKSKFLKKSLAALLAILMVAAMIPLSAAAAQVIGNGETIDVPGTTLAKGEDDYHWTATLPYNDTNGTATITLATDRQNVEFFTVGEDGTETTVATGRSAQVPVSGVTVSTPVTKTIVLRTIASDPAEVDALATYTVTVQKEATSTDATITGATVDLTVGATGGTTTQTYTAVVEGDTITFNNIAWGRMPRSYTSSGVDYASTKSVTDAASGDAILGVKVTMPNKPDATQSGFDVNAAHITDYKVENGVGTGKITAKAQNGNTKVYTVKFNEATSFTGITVAGVAAEQDTTDPTKWTVTVDPEDVDYNPTTEEVTFKASAPKRIDKMKVSVTNSTDALTSPSTTTNSSASTALTSAITDKRTFYVGIVDNKGNGTTCSVEVAAAKNSDTGIKAFKVSDGTYEEPGNVDTMTVTMQNGTTNATLDGTANPAVANHGKGILAITFKGKMQKVTLNGTALNYFDANDDIVDFATTAALFTSATNEDATTAGNLLSSTAALKVGNNTLVVTAEDGTQKTYNLVVKADPNKTTNPQITGATITLGADDEEISASKIDHDAGTITFTIPASLVKDVSATAVNGIKWNVTDHSTTNKADKSPSFVRYADASHASQTLYPETGTSAYDGYMTKGVKLYDKAAGSTGVAEVTDLKHEITVISDADTTGKIYKVYIEGANPNQVTRLTSIKFYDVENESEVTTDNTYEARGNDATWKAVLNKTIPYSLYKDNSKKLAVAFEIAPRAEIYYLKGTTGAEKVYHFDSNTTMANRTYKASGFDKKGRPQAGIPANEIDDIVGIIVVSESGVQKLADDNVAVASDTTTLADITGATGMTVGTDYRVYSFEKKTADASTLNQLVSLKSANGEVSAVINGFNVNLIVPPTYVVKNNETEFDLVAEISENAKLYKNDYTDPANIADITDPVTFENMKVVENADGTYSLSGVTKFQVVAQDGTTVANYALTVTVAELDGNADVSSITADGVAATEGEDDAWTVELPYGTDLEAVEVVATPASDKATPAVVKNDDGTYTITVTAERGNIKTYTLTVTVADKPAAPEFDDVPSWAQDAVNAVAAEGWMVGIGNNKFGPNGNIRRGDFALTIARILEEDWANVSADYAKDVFTDVKEGDWYYEAVAYIAEMGIMSGRGNGFDPRTGITREEAAKVMCLAMDLEPIEGETIFGDNASIAGWAKPYVNACQKAGVFNGTNGNFNPKDQLTRAQAAQIFKNGFIDYQPEDTTPDEPAE